MSKRNIFFVIAVLHMCVITHAMKKEVALPSAEILKTYLVDDRPLRSLHEEICKEFGDKQTSPDVVRKFIWNQIEEKSGSSRVFPGMKDAINTVVKLAFRDFPEALEDLTNK